jgi:ribonuclease R
MLDSAFGVSRWLRRIAKHPLRAVLEGLLLRSLKLAQYDITNVGHFGLASEAYVHFTSPIRRYPDLLVHRISKSLLRGRPVVTDPAAIEALRAATTRTSEVERVVMQAEREVVDVYRCLFMLDKVGEVYEGRVTGLAGSGVYAVLDEPFVDVLVRFESLGPDRYEAGDDGLSVAGRRSGDRISLGDRVTLVIEDVALLRRTIYARRVPPAHAFEHVEAEPTPLEGLAPRRGKGRRHESPPAGAAAVDAVARRRGKLPSQPPAPSHGRGKRRVERGRTGATLEDENGRGDKPRAAGPERRHVTRPDKRRR